MYKRKEREARPNANPNANILAVDATGEVLSVAVGSFELKRAAKKHDEALLPLVERLLKKAKLRWEDLDAIAAASGPGRFTGIRIGMSFAAAAGFQLKIPVIAISRLAAAAGRAKSGRALGALPGWKDEVYTQEFRKGKAFGAAAFTPPKDWPALRDAAEKSGLSVSYGETTAADLLPVARAALAAGKMPPFEPFYLKPASYERPRG
ncbi:MAG: tRNA (adenosine(37)-N6)-threonylcarbamoyltransferase complex dimerization subunit type 1 TsaB [Elusimicrobia bacterium]|nr:tRNA (adenosine(37)-N6)-threonylcarbamoyltransferase complex dimerization subunit type 1 TsaB [Elusimicrobiota bacterium]